MIKRLRLAVLVYLLLFVALGNYLTAARSTDWDAPLWVDVYPINGDGSARTQQFIDNLPETEFSGIEGFFSKEAKRYGVALDMPFRLELAPQITREIPELPAGASTPQALLWSLKVRWLAGQVERESNRPDPDIQLFAVYHDDAQAQQVDRSAALEKGLVAVANVFAGRANRGSNQVVMAHELLHTLGATDKYDPATNTPLFPLGYAAPDAKPLHPQRNAEIMAGRIALDEDEAEIPSSLASVVVGRATAMEIGWVSPKER